MKTLIGLKRCTTCKRAEAALQERGAEYTYREIDKEPPTLRELESWKDRTRLKISRFWNTSGIRYREEGLSAKRKEWTEEKQLETIASDGMLCKRPILIEDDGTIYIGPDVLKHINGEA